MWNHYVIYTIVFLLHFNFNSAPFALVAIQMKMRHQMANSFYMTMAQKAIKPL